MSESSILKLAQGIEVENADLNASALRVSFDAEKEFLLLEGSDQSPVTLTLSRVGGVIRAQRIKLSLKDLGFTGQYRSVGPH